MDNELEPKPNEQPDKHAQAKADLEELQRMVAEYHENHPEIDETSKQSVPAEQETPQEADQTQQNLELEPTHEEPATEQPEVSEPSAEPEEPEQPEQTEQATEPEEAAQPEQAEQSAQPEPTEAAEQAEPTEPVETAQPAASTEPVEAAQPAEPEEGTQEQLDAAALEQKKAAEAQAAAAQADAEQKQREEILDKQAKRNHPDQPLATMKIKKQAKQPASGGKKQTAQKPAAKKSAKSKKAAAARRRKKRLMRLGATVVILLVLIVVVVSVVRGLNDNGNQLLSNNDAGSGSATNVTSQTEQLEETNLPASQQESEQYQKIKDDTSLPAYALEYPGMYADAVSEPNVESDQKVCYLTFDDGPSSTNTPGILDALKEADVKATFFVVASEIDGNEDIVKRIVDEGHTLCIHANEHVYGNLYNSVEDYLKDFAAAYDKIYDLTGYRVQGFRFPGGSNNVVMQRHDTYNSIVSEMTRRGFEYYDWNAYDHDAENGDYSVDQLVSYAVHEVTSSSRNDTILLMHDTYGKEKTVQALPTIISKLKDAGIEMLPITNSSRPVHFEVNENTPSDLPDTSDTTETGDAESETTSGTDTTDTEA